MRFNIVAFIYISLLMSSQAIAHNQKLTCMSNYAGMSYSEDAEILRNDIGVTVTVKSTNYESKFIGDLDHASDGIGVSFDKTDEGFIIDSSSSPAEIYLSQNAKTKKIILTRCK